MATIAIPKTVQSYFPKSVDPSQLWVKHNPEADSLTIYFTGQPVPSVWQDVDDYAYIGLAVDNQTNVTGLMIEHFSKWLLVSDHQEPLLEPVAQD
jgi:hypothetical protein